VMFRRILITMVVGSCSHLHKAALPAKLTTADLGRNDQRTIVFMFSLLFGTKTRCVERDEILVDAFLPMPMNGVWYNAGK